MLGCDVENGEELECVAVGEFFPEVDPFEDDDDVGALAIADAHSVMYWLVTPCPFALTPVCSSPLPKPDHDSLVLLIIALYALKIQTSDR